MGSTSQYGGKRPAERLRAQPQVVDATRSGTRRLNPPPGYAACYTISREGKIPDTGKAGVAGRGRHAGRRMRRDEMTKSSVTLSVVDQ